MKNKQKSSVEWLYNKMYEHRGNITIEEFEQAVAMHKEEMIDFAMKFMMQDRPIISFYNSTYGGEDEPQKIE